MRTSRSLLSISVVLSVVATAGLVNPPAAAATETTPTTPTTPTTRERCEHERNYPFIALSVAKPKKHAEVAVDERGEITVEGIVNKRADLLDVSIDDVVTDDFETKGPPHGLGLFKSYSAKIRPPRLGGNTLCVRAERLHKTAQQKRTFTAVDRIPPSDVPAVTVGGVTATSATVSWGAATDNYGLAGYDVVVDGGAPHRTAVGNRSYPISGLMPSTAHTVSVVAVDLAGNRSAAPATVSFTTDGTGPPPNGDFTFVTDEGGATAQWSPDAVNDEAYRMYLDGQPYTDDIPLSELCTLCGPDTVLDFDIEPLDSNTSYTFKVEVIGDGGAVIRTLEGGFRTTDGPDYTSAGTDEFVGTESKRCAGLGGDLFLAPVARSGVSVPPGSSQVFDGCWTVPDSSCFDALLPLSTARVRTCADDVTRVLRGLAPPGRGPVISSIDDLVDYPGVPAAQSFRFQSVPICTASPQVCTVVVTTAAQAGRVILLAELLAVTTAALVFSAVAVALGLVLFAVYEALFGSEITFGGIFEYPISPEDDFDAFDNWHQEDGEWVNSLKTYAETVKTTKLLANDHNLPFQWTDSLSQQLKRQIDSACSAQRGVQGAAGCQDNYAVYVPGAQSYRFRPMPETGKHITDAMGNGGFPFPPERIQWYAPSRSVGGRAAINAGFRRNWFNTGFQPNNCTAPVPVTVCDEFPFWSTTQAVNLSGPLASLRRVPRSEALPQAQDISHFYSKCRVADAEKFMVLPVPGWVAANGPSFAFRVNQGGANMCMVPTVP